MKVLTLLSLFIIWSCSTSPKVVQPNIPTGNDPEWIFAPMSGCEETFELCASGEGSSFARSDVEAKKALASIFQTQIKSNLRSSTFTYLANDFEKQEAIENTMNSVQEQVDEVLETVEIKERFQRDELFFSLAKMDKVKVSKILRSRIDQIDGELSVLAEQKRKSLLKQMVTLFEQRRNLNEKLIIVRGAGIKSPIDQKFLERIRYAKNKLIKKVLVRFNEDFSKSLRNQIVKMISQLGHVIVEEGEELVVLGNLKINDEHIKVKGFVKKSFDLSLETQYKEDTIGKITTKVFATGRSHADAYVKAEQNIILEIENQLSQLNLD